MALDAHHAGFGGVFVEFILEMFVTFGHYKAYIHKGTVFFAGNSTFEQGIGVDFFVQQGCLLFIHLMYDFDAAEFFVPEQGLQGCVNGHHRRSIEHGFIFDMGFIVEDGRNGTTHFIEHAFAYNYQSDARGSQVFLCSGKNQSVRAEIDGA